jgi:hypothetical protein
MKRLLIMTSMGVLGFLFGKYYNNNFLEHRMYLNGKEVNMMDAETAIHAMASGQAEMVTYFGLPFTNFGIEAPSWQWAMGIPIFLALLGIAIGLLITSRRVRLHKAQRN